MRSDQQIGFAVGLDAGLVETQSPCLGRGGKNAREEHFYCDGSRHVQEASSY